MADLTIRDSNSRLRITCLKRDGSIFNLTGYTLALRFRIGKTTHANVAMTVIDAPNGIAEYAFTATNLSEEGIMYAEVEVTETATAKLTSSAEVLILVVKGKVS